MSNLRLWYSQRLLQRNPVDTGAQLQVVSTEQFMGTSSSLNPKINFERSAPLPICLSQVHTTLPDQRFILEIPILPSHMKDFLSFAYNLQVVIIKGFSSLSSESKPHSFPPRPLPKRTAHQSSLRGYYFKPSCVDSTLALVTRAW